jgi:methyl coenzyme M reductase subunit C-like uncharacterized protein (methanogenesis marker protein 7)
LLPTQFALIAIGGKLLGGHGLASSVANCPVTPQAPVINSIATPAPEPPKAALCPFPTSVSNPAPVAFQLDGNWAQEPYDAWLDNVTLSAY